MLFYHPTEEIEKGIARVSKAGMPVLIAITRGMGHSMKDLSKRLPSISIPVLILFGEKDRNAKQGEEMRKLIRHSKIAIVERAAHMAHRDNPEQFNKLLANFCASVKGVSAALREYPITQQAVA